MREGDTMHDHEDDAPAQDAPGTGPDANTASDAGRDVGSAPGTHPDAEAAGQDRSDEITEVIAGSGAAQTADTEVLPPAADARGAEHGVTPGAGTEEGQAMDEHPAAEGRMPRGTASMPSARYGFADAYPSTPPRPRVRAGAIVWGLLVVAFAAAVIAVSATPGARNAFDAWQASLTPATWAVIGVVALGIAVLLIAGVSAIRSAQRRADGAR